MQTIPNLAATSQWALVTTGLRISFNGLLNAGSLINIHFHWALQPSFPHLASNLPSSFTLETRWWECDSSQGAVLTTGLLNPLLIQLSRDGELWSNLHLRHVSICVTMTIPISTTIPPRHFVRAPTQGTVKNLFRSYISTSYSPHERFRNVDQPRPHRTVLSILFRKAGFVAKGKRGRSIVRAIPQSHWYSRGNGRRGHHSESGQCIEIRSSRLLGTSS